MKCLSCGAEMTNTIGGNYHCPACGFAVNDLVYRGGKTANSINDGPNPPIVDNNVAYPNIGDSPDNCFWAPRGWICPKCGATLSPSTTFCPFCAPGNNKTTITSTGTTYDVDWTHKDSTTETSSVKSINSNINTALRKE